MASFIRLTSVVLSLLAALAASPVVSAEDVAQPSYDACRYAKHLIRTPETFYIGGIVGVSWLEAAVCEETNEDCALIGHLCGGDVPGYENLENLCGGGEELKVCVPRTSLNDPNGVCVAISDGCAAAAGLCREASCDLGPWTPPYPPEPIVPGNDHNLQVHFALPSYERPAACVFTPKPTEICDFTTPPPPPTEHPCDGIVDLGLKACCEEQGGLDLDAIEACVPDSDDPSDVCNIIINGNIENSGQMNICCQYVNNSGVIEDSEIVQECENVSTPGGDVPVPGIPERSESAGGAPTCTVTALEADGQILHQTSCEEEAGLHTQRGSSGCSLIRD